MSAVETLIHSLRSNNIATQNVRALFLNAHMHADLSAVVNSSTDIQQFFKTDTKKFEDAGYAVTPEIPEEENTYDYVFLIIPKNIVEAKFLIAKSLMVLKKGGTFFCSADNKSGGGRLKKLMQEFGISSTGDLTKNKARCVWTIKTDINLDAVEKAIQTGSSQEVLGGSFISQPGIYGWNKIDKGSALLINNMPESLKGRGADFGCGYGYLSHALLKRYTGISKLTCIDSDIRAIDACRKNLDFSDCEIMYDWMDLAQQTTYKNAFDFIVMNPPFHEGKKTSIDLGKQFIETAYTALAKGGRLYMVANAHLPYESCLMQLFSSCKSICEEGGFKIFHALK